MNLASSAIWCAVAAAFAVARAQWKDEALVQTVVRDINGNTRLRSGAARGEKASKIEREANIGRAVARDPDLWVIEIEHRDGWHPFEGKVL